MFLLELLPFDEIFVMDRIVNCPLEWSVGIFLVVKERDF